MARHGMTINDEQVEALTQLFRKLDQGADPSVILRSPHIGRFRAALQRIEKGQRGNLMALPCYCAEGRRSDCPTHGSSDIARKLRRELQEVSR